MTVKFKKDFPDVQLPVKGSRDAACYDVYAYKVKEKGFGKVEVELGFKTEIPIGFKGIIIPRSNLTKHKWSINNSPATIDADFRGSWKIIFTSAGQMLFPYKEGDRVAQMYFEKVLEVEFEEVDELTETTRGEGGFGSTGLK